MEKLREEKLKSEASSRSKSEFIANMSHDLRTPMSGIVGMFDEVLFSAQDEKGFLSANPAARDLLSHFRSFANNTEKHAALGKQSAKELLGLLNEILEATRLQSGKLTEAASAFDLIHLINQSVGLFQSAAHDKQLELFINISRNIPRYVSGLQFCFGRSLLNLVSNALKFTKKGSVTILVSLVGNNVCPLRLGSEAILKVQVKDTGIGIPADKFAEVFDSFSRLNPSYQGVYKGSGLGLCVVKHYAEAMQGSIGLESEVGKGTCFTLTVPFVVDDHADSSGASESDIQAITNAFMGSCFSVKTAVSSGEQVCQEKTEAQILLVEDNAIAAISGKLLLERLGCSVSVAGNGEVALFEVKDKKYDLVFMDIGLPDISGIEVAKIIRALPDLEKSNTPIIALTGHAGDPEQQQACFDVGINKVLSKPADLKQIRSVLECWVFNNANGLDAPVALRTCSNNITGAAVIDWEGCVSACFDDKELAQKFLAMIVDGLEKTKIALEEAYVKNNIAGLLKELHHCRGGIHYLSLPQLEMALRRFHEAIRDSLVDQMELEEAYQGLQQALQNYLDTWRSEKIE